MNLKKMLIIMILITLTAAGILIWKVKHDFPEEIEISLVVEEIPPTEVKLPEVCGTMPPANVIKTVEKKVTKHVVSNDELYILSHIMGGECGSDTCPDEMQIATGSVFLNRIASPYFPNDAEAVAFQKNQYSCTRKGGGYWKEPTQRTIDNARWLLENGSQLPENVLFQSQFKQADGVYKKVGNQYYCYKEVK